MLRNSLRVMLSVFTNKMAFFFKLIVETLPRKTGLLKESIAIFLRLLEPCLFNPISLLPSGVIAYNVPPFLSIDSLLLLFMVLHHMNFSTKSHQTIPFLELLDV